MNIHHCVPLRFRHFPQCLVLDKAGIVDNRINASAFSHHPFYQLCTVFNTAREVNRSTTSIIDRLSRPSVIFRRAIDRDGCSCLRKAS